MHCITLNSRIPLIQDKTYRLMACLDHKSSHNLIPDNARLMPNGMSRSDHNFKEKQSARC
uniref:Uncharacterized protein n=1 Tax=Arundo donax TaxID=35708 RepID=A0A0A9C942_ARUDO